MSDKMYRYEDVACSWGLNEYDDPIPGYNLILNLQTYKVLKQTPKGVWIDLLWKRKFILLKAKKRFACPTKKEALESFKRRKEAQIRILEEKLSRAKKALSLAKIDHDLRENPKT